MPDIVIAHLGTFDELRASYLARAESIYHGAQPVRCKLRKEELEWASSMVRARSGSLSDQADGAGSPNQDSANMHATAGVLRLCFENNQQTVQALLEGRFRLSSFQL